MNWKEALERIKSMNPDPGLYGYGFHLLQDLEEFGLIKPDFTSHDVKSLMMYVQKARTELHEKEKRWIIGKRTEKKLPRMFESALTSEGIAERISPLVKKIRLRFFETESPVLSVDEPETFIKAVIEKPEETLQRKLENLELRVLNTEALLKGIGEISSATGWAFKEAFLHVLSGSIPRAPRFRLRLQRNKSSGITRARLDIYCKDLSFEELKEIYRKLRKEMNIVKKKALKDGDSELYRFVETKKDEVKTKRRGAKSNFWEKVLDEWNRQHSKRQFTHYRGLQVAHERISRRLAEHDMNIAVARR